MKFTAPHSESKTFTQHTCTLCVSRHPSLNAADVHASNMCMCNFIVYRCVPAIVVARMSMIFVYLCVHVHVYALQSRHAHCLLRRACSESMIHVCIVCVYSCASVHECIQHSGHVHCIARRACLDAVEVNAWRVGTRTCVCVIHVKIVLTCEQVCACAYPIREFISALFPPLQACAICRCTWMLRTQCDL
jgi:hypothetical protein